MLFFAWLSFTELLGYSLLAIVPFLIVPLALYTHYIGAPSWVARKIIHICGNSLFALYLVLTRNIIAILYITLLVIAGLMVLGLIFPGFITFMLEITTRTGEDSTEMQLNVLLSLTTVVILYLTLMSFFDDARSIFLVSVLAFSIGDGFGELIGKPFGKHKFRSSTKSVEGSIAVFFGAFLSAVYVYYFYGLLNLQSLWILLISSSIASIVEALSKKFYDNILIPISVAVTLLLLQ